MVQHDGAERDIGPRATPLRIAGSCWHEAARASDEMREFLGMGAEDKCLGFFMVAACEPSLKDSRTRRPEAHLSVEWRE